MAKGGKNINLILVIIAIAILAIVLIVPMVSKLFKSGSDRGKKIPDPGKFSADNQAKIIRDKIMRFWGFGELDDAVLAFEQILSYSDGELVKVANAYRSIYSDKSYNTLRELIKSQATYVSPKAAKLKEDVLKRFDQLNIA